MKVVVQQSTEAGCLGIKIMSKQKKKTVDVKMIFKKYQNFFESLEVVNNFFKSTY